MWKSCMLCVYNSVVWTYYYWPACTMRQLELEFLRSIQRMERKWERESHTYTETSKPGRANKKHQTASISKESLWLVAVLGKRKHTNKSSTDTSASMQTFHTFQRIKRFTRHQVFPTRRSHLSMQFLLRSPLRAKEATNVTRMPDLFINTGWPVTCSWQRNGKTC